ncbi:2-dehydropantoate 2-reductase [Lederbergia citrea]|uniref:2-dehydropantoate 2-reductase n=1 Tax=Lederbergia citrea TaxID=2833581 RepID=A0A942UHG1_9BACI|nr:2-dehydropantoate 2-reductase [Lederbergia citrea]
MNIGIIGGGAVGLLFGAYYSSEFNVAIFTKTREQANLINAQGIKLLRQGVEITCVAKGFANYENLESQDFIIVCVKQYDLESLIPILNHIPKRIPMLFIQNGMGHLNQLNSLPHQTIFIGTVEHGVVRLDKRTVMHTGVGKVNIGIYRGIDEGEAIFPSVNKPGFPFSFQTNYEEMLQSKLLANAVINPLTAIFKVKNGQLLENSSYYQAFLLLYTEIAALFPKMHEKGVFNEIEAICRKTKNNTSSMLKDILEGRETEIDAILGYIIKEGEKVGVKMPISTMIYHMIKGMEFERGSRE